MHKRLIDFLEVNKILHSLQLGFRQKHPSAHTLISITEKIRNLIDNGNYDVEFLLTSRRLLILQTIQFC